MALSVFERICLSLHRPPLLQKAPFKLQSVSGHPLDVRGITQVRIKNAASIQVYVVADLGHQCILGIDSLMKGKAQLDVYQQEMK